MQCSILLFCTQSESRNEKKRHKHTNESLNMTKKRSFLGKEWEKCRHFREEEEEEEERL